MVQNLPNNFMEKLLKQMKDNWLVYAFLISMVLWYGSTNSRLQSVEAEQKEQKTTLQKLDQLIIDVAVVKTDVKYIKDEVKH